MASWTVISDRGATSVDVNDDHRDGQVWAAPEVVFEVLGWEVKPQGLCRGEVCVPASSALRPDESGRVDLVAVAEALSRPTLVDASVNSLVVGSSAVDRSAALEGGQLPAFELPDLDGAVHRSEEWLGRKMLLVAFASW